MDESGLTQGVVCHPVFATPTGVDNIEFDDLMALLKTCSPADLAIHATGLGQVYKRLLESGFFDAYLGIYFDVDTVTSYVTVVSTMIYAFDKKWRSTPSTITRVRMCESFLQRVSNVLYLRRFCDRDVSTVENARYFSFLSVLREVAEHVNSLNPSQTEHGVWPRVMLQFGPQNHVTAPRF